MTNKRVYAWTARLAALLVAASVIPACSLLGGPYAGTPINFFSTSSGPVAPGTPSTNGVIWASPNLAVQGPIGIVGIGGIEVTYGDADSVAFPPGNAETPHPISTSRSLDPTGESIINSMVQQLYTANVGNGQGGQQVNVGPVLYTGDPKLAGISRGRAKHSSLHTPAAAPDPGGLPARLAWMKVNANYTGAQQVEVSGAGMTPTAAATAIANALRGYVGGITTNAYGAAGYWTSGVTNYYVFTILQVLNGGP